jgi:hypothetical protein
MDCYMVRIQLCSLHEAAEMLHVRGPQLHSRHYCTPAQVPISSRLLSLLATQTLSHVPCVFRLAILDV